MERPVYVNPSPGDLVTCLTYCICLLKSNGLLEADKFNGVPVADWLTGVTWPDVDGVVGAWLVTAAVSICSIDGSEGPPEEVEYNTFGEHVYKQLNSSHLGLSFHGYSAKIPAMPTTVGAV